MATRIGRLALAAGLGFALCAPGSVQAGETFVYKDLGGGLNAFDTDDPETPLRQSGLTVTGLAGNHEIKTIDFRPSDGNLYALTRNSVDGTGRLYTIDLTTGAATSVGLLGMVLPNEVYAMDFNPVSDRLRVVSNGADMNLVVDPATGTATAETDLAYAAGDQYFGQNPAVADIAHDRIVPGATATTVYVHDDAGGIANPPRLARLGGVDGSPAPSGGQLTTIAPLGSSFGGGGTFGLEFSSAGTLYLLETVVLIDADTYLATVDPATGERTPVGETPVIFNSDTAIAPSSTLALSAKNFSVSEGGGSATVTVTRTGSTNGPARLVYGTSDGSAEGADYSGVVNELTIPAGAASANITIPIAQDAAAEGRESFTVIVADARGSMTAGASLGAPNSATVTIEDDEAAAADTTPPNLSVTKVPKSLALGRFLKGVSATLATDEPATIEAELRGTLRGARLARFELRLAARQLARGSGQRTIRLKPKRKLVGRPRKAVKVQLRLSATDDGGNRRVVTRTIAVKRPKKR